MTGKLPRCLTTQPPKFTQPFTQRGMGNEYCTSQSALMLFGWGVKVGYSSLHMCGCQVTRCLHFTAGCTTGCTTSCATGCTTGCATDCTTSCATGCTTGWANYTNDSSQTALERSSQDAYDVNRLTRSKAAVWTVDDLAHLIEISLRELFFIY